MSALLTVLGIVIGALGAYAVMNPDQRSDMGSYLVRLWFVLAACLCAYQLVAFLGRTGEVSRWELITVILNAMGMFAMPFFALGEIMMHRRVKAAKENDRVLKAALEKYKGR